MESILDLWGYCGCQTEFIFRNAKQFTGLQDCQARDLPKLEFHFNASLTALNLARVEAQQHHKGDQPFVFSMASVKRRALNQHLLNRFIADLDWSQLRLNPTPTTKPYSPTAL